jgi:hypothetical protein
MLEEGLYYNQHGERYNITNMFDEDGEEIDPTDPEVDLADVVVIVAEHPLADGGYLTLDINDAGINGPDDVIVVEDIGWRH